MSDNQKLNRFSVKTNGAPNGAQDWPDFWVYVHFRSANREQRISKGIQDLESTASVIKVTQMMDALKAPSREPVTISGAPSPTPSPPTASMQLMICECAFTE